MQWQRLADEVELRRTRLGYDTREKFTAETGFPPRTLSDIERRRRTNYDRATLARLERALQWQPGSVQVVLDGGEPIPADESVPVSWLEEIGSQLATLTDVLTKSNLDRVAASRPDDDHAPAPPTDGPILIVGDPDLAVMLAESELPQPLMAMVVKEFEQRNAEYRRHLLDEIRALIANLRGDTAPRDPLTDDDIVLIEQTRVSEEHKTRG